MSATPAADDFRRTYGSPADLADELAHDSRVDIELLLIDLRMLRCHPDLPPEAVPAVSEALWHLVSTQRLLQTLAADLAEG